MSLRLVEVGMPDICQIDGHAVDGAGSDQRPRSIASSMATCPLRHGWKEAYYALQYRLPCYSPLMATITLRIDDSVRDRLQAVAEGQGLNVSDVLRSLIDGLFDRDDREAPRRPIVPESMTAVDRKQLALLHKILARLVEDKIEDRRLGEDGDTAYQLDRAQALEAGWTAEYDMEYYVMEPELSRRDCGLVMDIFGMFRMLKYSIGKVGDQLNDTDLAMLTFHGFDLNDEFESRLLQYARWLISDGERWQEQAEVFAAEHDRGNSHMPTLGAYQRMLAAYEPIWRRIVHRHGRANHLSLDELQEIAAAGIHPSHRRAQ